VSFQRGGQLKTIIHLGTTLSSCYASPPLQAQNQVPDPIPLYLVNQWGKPVSHEQVQAATDAVFKEKLAQAKASWEADAYQKGIAAQSSNMFNMNSWHATLPAAAPLVLKKPVYSALCDVDMDVEEPAAPEPPAVPQVVPQAPVPAAPQFQNWGADAEKIYNFMMVQAFKHRDIPTHSVWYLERSELWQKVTSPDANDILKELKETLLKMAFYPKAIGAVVDLYRSKHKVPTYDLHLGGNLSAVTWWTRVYIIILIAGYPQHAIANTAYLLADAETLAENAVRRGLTKKK